jgi:hypothetical protein
MERRPSGRHYGPPASGRLGTDGTSAQLNAGVNAGGP